METPTYEIACRNNKGQFVKGARKSKVKAHHKKCTECLKVKPFEDFHKQKSSLDGRRSKCKTCRKVLSTQDYIERKDFIRSQQSKARNKMTPEQRKHERERIDRWNKENPEKIKEYAKKYCKGNGREIKYESYQRRRAMLANAVTDNHTIKELHVYWLEQGYDPDVCTYCDEPIEAETSIGDHVIPLSRGGSHTVDNLVPACLSCNSSKCDKLLSEWTQPGHGKKVA